VSERARLLSRYGWRPADPPRRPVLFVNPASGGGKPARAALADRARERGIAVVEGALGIVFLLLEKLVH
jgi:hypothetical protein